MKISLLHTAEVHIKTFDSVFNSLGHDVIVDHKVRPELLARARCDGLEAVRHDTLTEIESLADADVVVCTCSTLGPLVDDVAQTHSHVIRGDRPMMEDACRAGKDVLVAICLESTRDATRALLMQSASDSGCNITPRLVLCDAAWPYFESGDMERFASEIAASISSDIAANSVPDCIVLAQVSMRVATQHLEHFGVPVMSSPKPAVSHAVNLASELSG